eukprot:scaffold180060_cov31-Tisochrysis_lutea.AAC.3
MNNRKEAIGKCGVDALERVYTEQPVCVYKRPTCAADATTGDGDDLRIGSKTGGARTMWSAASFPQSAQ